MRLEPLLLPLFICSTLLAYQPNDGCRASSDYYYADRERGWFWSEAPCVQKETNTSSKEKSTTKPSPKSKYKLVPKIVEIPWDIIDQIDPEQIATMERDAQKTSMMYPTDYNVKQHRMLQKYVIAKSVSYAKVGDRLGHSDTDLSAWRTEKPNTAMKRDVQTREVAKKSDEIIKAYSQRAGLVVIVQPGCGYCEQQKPVLAMLKEETGFSYKLVDMSQAPQIVTKLGVARTPDIFLVLNRNGQAQWQRVTSGMNTLSELKQAIIMGLYTVGEIKDESVIYH